jgi:hypothetical protein
VTALLVPPLVFTVTETVPGTVKLFVPFPAGTTTAMPLSVQPPAFGVTVAVMPLDDWEKITEPGELWKPLPLISMGRLTGLDGSVELLIFWIEGTGGGAVLLEFEPPQPTNRPDAIRKASPAARDAQ